MIYLFTSKLKPKTKNEVRQRNPQSLKEAVTINMMKRFDRKNKNNYKSLKCFKCSGMGHKAANCKKEVKREPFKKDKKCFKCGKYGHLSKNCRAKTFRANMLEVQKTLVNVLTGTEDRLLTIDGTVDGHDVEFAFESGASSSVISARSEEKYSLYIRKSNANVQSIFGEVKQVKGITEDLEICVAGRVVFLPLLKIDNQEHAVLLGLNWFKIIKAGLFPSEGILTFEKKRKYFLEGSR